MMAPPTFNNNSPGWINSTGPGLFINPRTGYHSPWDIWFRNHPFTPIYHFVNDGGPAHTSPFHVEITCYVGLAYFDGNDDGSYDDPALNPTGPPVQVADLTNGNYPNLYATGHEIGNLLPTKPIILDGNNLDGAHVVIVSDPANPNAEHLPRTPAFLSPIASNANNQVFDVIGTPHEQALLADYGKVFYFEVTVIDKASGIAVLGSPFLVQVANETLPGGSGPFYNEWEDLTLALGIQAPTPAGAADIFYYYNNNLPTPGTVWGTGTIPGYPDTDPGVNHPDYQCDSREVVLGMLPPVFHEIPFSAGSGTNNWRVVAAMPIGSWLWQTSGPYVGVIPN